MPQNRLIEVENRRVVVARLYLRGMLMEEISSVVGVSRRQVGKDLAQIRKAWLQSAIRDFDEAKAQELAKWDNLERTYWEAWERSLKTRTKKTKKLGAKKEDGSRKVSERITTKEKRDGDPRFLDGVFKCISERCKILDMYPRQNIQNNINFVHLQQMQEYVSAMDDTELTEYIEMLEGDE